MERHFDHDLAELKQKLLTMASHAEKSVSDAVSALVNRDLDEMAINLLAKAPLASELRLVTMAMKLSQNLERVGDEATKIAKRARDLSKEPPLKLNLEIPRMSTLALGLLKASLAAFVNRDPVAARALIPRDKEVNTLHKQIQ